MEITKETYSGYLNNQDDLILLASDGVTKISYIPPQSTQLHITNNPITEICEIPETVYIINLAYTKISKLPKLPEGLRVLDTRGTNLPEGLQGFYKSKVEVDIFKRKLKIKEYIKLI